jgi:hypothetical protein
MTDQFELLKKWSHHYRFEQVFLIACQFLFQLSISKANFPLSKTGGCF